MKTMRFFPYLPYGSGMVRMTLALLLILPVHAYVASQELALENPNRVKAAFLRNFVHYVTWPVTALPVSQAPWQVCILGRDPFGDLMENTFKGRTEQNRPFEIHRAEALDKLPLCHIVFVAYDTPLARRTALSQLKNKPVLTVGEAPDFLREGGIIQFQVADRVRMSINLDQARAASLAIQTRMLEVSHEIVENGMTRKVR